MAKKDSLQTTPRLVKEVPKGYTEEIRDGKKVYVLKKETITPKKPTSVKPKATTSVKSGTPKRMPPSSKPVVPASSMQEDVVYLEDPKVTPVTQNIQRLRTDLKEDFPSGLQKGYHSYKVPDLTTGGNYANAKSVITDSEGMPVVYDFKQGKYIQTGEPSIHSNMPVQNDTPTIQDPLKQNELPTIFDSNPERLRTGKYNSSKAITPVIDETKGFNDISSNAVNNTDFQMEQAKKLAIPKLKKGGIVSKIKGYNNGGNISNNPYLSGNPNIPNQGQQFTSYGKDSNFYSGFGNSAESGVVQQADAYGRNRINEEQKTLEAEEKKKIQNEKAKQIAGNVLGAYGATYAATAKPSGSQDQATKTAMGVVSGTGAVGGIIGGLYGIIDKPARAEKNKAEKMNVSYDANGKAIAKLNNSTVAKNTAIAGSLLSPSEALSTRLSYKGGLTDISGRGYTDHLEKKAQDQLDVYNKANKEYKTKLAIQARDAGNFNPIINNRYDLKGASFGDDKLLDGIEGYAKGGEIKGKGTAKSDSINAKVENGSFIVPEENAEIAEELREKFLGKPPKSKATLNEKGGVPVKLSNGEHKFTLEEKHELMEKGINVKALAPNAEESNMKSNGGEIKKGAKVKSAQSDTGYLTWDGNKWISDNLKLNEKGQADVTKQYFDEQKSSFKASLPGLKKHYEYIKDKPDRKKEASDLLNDINNKESFISGKTKDIPKVSPSVTKSTSLKVPKMAKKVQAGRYIPPSASYDPKDDITVPGDNLSPLERSRLTASENKVDANVAALNNSLPQTLPTESYNSQRKGNGILGKIGNIDPTALLGVGQAAMGYNMLKDQVRPKDNAVIDPTYNAAVNRSLQDATFGLTPEQKFAAEQDIQNSLNDSKAVGLNYSGGSGVQAFNTNRAAINDAWKAKLGLSVADTDLRMQKQKYADAMAADRANILASNRRQAFNDAMGAFQQNQNAGSELIGAGLQNTIGAYRFNKIKNQQDQENYTRNPYNNYNP